MRSLGARFCGLLAGMLLLCGGHPRLPISGARAADSPSEDAGAMSVEDLQRMLTDAPPTAERLARLKRNARLAPLAFRRAAGAARSGGPVLNVIEYMLEFGYLDTRVWSALDLLLGSSGCMEAEVEALAHVGPHRHELRVRGLHLYRGEGRPSHFLVRRSPDESASAFHARMLGRRLVFCFSTELMEEGYALPADQYWEATGREQRIFSATLPLALRSPKDLLPLMTSEDETGRWLATARAILLSKALPEEVAPWRREYTLSRSHVEELRQRVVAGLRTLESRIRWDADQAHWMLAD